MSLIINMNHSIYQQLAEAVVKMNAVEVVRLSKRVLEEGYPPEEAIEQGLAKGMSRVGELFACKEYFVPEVLVCARAMYAGFDILKEEVIEGSIPDKGRIVIGVVEGDFHDIGKNIVKLMLEAAGFKIIDLGKNVPLESYLSAVEENHPHIAAFSTLMTTTMENMAEILGAIRIKYPSVKMMIGGAPVNQDFADNIGAHFYGEDARQAVKGAHQLLKLPLL